MKRVRITLYPREEYAPRVYELLAGGADYLERARIVNWNVAAPPTAFLLWLRGDYERFEREANARPEVRECEVVPIGDRECHCFLDGEVATAARRLFENFTRGSLLTVAPIEINRDGSNTFAIVGADADIQAAIEGAPDGVSVTVEAVGGDRVARTPAVGRLSPRQREAVEVAVALGYYEVPRGATTADVARELDCATATAAEHLQRAEAELLASLFED